MNQLDFTLPKASNDAEKLRPAPKHNAISDWLDNLPLINSSQSAHLVCNYLSELNITALKSSQRFDVCEQLRPTCYTLSETLRPKYVRANLPLSDKNEAYFSHTIAINHLMMIAYKSILNDAQEHSNQSQKTQLMVQSLYHAMHFLSLIMLECYLVYRPIPKSTWNEFHQLYYLAEKNNILDLLIPLTEKSGHVETIDLTYKRSIILSLSGPYHLMQEEAYHVFLMLGKLAQGLRIDPYPEKETLETGFAIDLESDQSPMFISSERNVSLFKPRELNINSLIDAFKSHIIKLEESVLENIKNEESTLSIRLQSDLLARLNESWTRKRDRVEQRKTSMGTRDIIINLSTSHYYASHKVPFTPEIDEIKYFNLLNDNASGLSLSLLPKEVEPWKTDEAEQRMEAGIDQPRLSNFDDESSTLDKWEKIYSVRSSRDSDEIQQAVNVDTKYMLSTWDIRNISSNGMSLSCNADKCLPIRVGELIAYREDKQWVLSAIRWLHATEQHSLELGIMTFARGCTNVATRAVSGIGKGGEYMRSLLIDASTLSDPQAKLILPAAIYHIGTELVINLSAHITYAKLTDVTLNTKSFTVYHFKVIDMPDAESNNIEALKQLL